MNSLKKIKKVSDNNTNISSNIKQISKKKKCENLINTEKNEISSFCDDKNKCSTDKIPKDKKIESIKVSTSISSIKNSKDIIHKIENISNKLKDININSKESIEELSQNTKANSNDLSNNEITIKENENNKETKKNLNINKYLEIFDELSKYIDFPKKNELNIKVEINDIKYNDDQFFLALKVYSLISKLNEKIDDIKHLLKNYYGDISSSIIRMKNNSNFKMLEITNMRLEILINLLKNPNIINIKRKIIEITIFHLYSENSEYFELDNNYLPPFSHLIELEKLIISKSAKNKNNKDILEDKKKLENIKLSIKNNKKIPNVNQPKNNDKVKIKHLNEVKDFLEFYLSKLYPYVHISENKGKFYSLPNSIFKTNCNAMEYLFTLESIVGEEKIKEKYNKKNIIGLSNKNEMYEEPIYCEKKVLSIDEAINILFSYDTNISHLENDVIKQINEKQKEFKNDLDKFNYKYKNLFEFDEIRDNELDDCIDFSKTIQNQINNYVEIFRNNVITKLYDILNLLLFEQDFKDCQAIINALNSFLKNFISNSKLKINYMINKEFKDKNQMMFFVIIKIYIVEKMIELFLDYKKKIQNYLEQKEKEFLYLVKIIKLNLKNINNYVKENNKPENILDIYKKWSRKFANAKLKINELKNYLKENINKKMNLEMNYTFDNKFCL